jgi:hypothetical protein
MAPGLDGVLSTRDCLGRRLAGQIVNEAHVVREGAVGGGERADGGREVVVEGGPLVAEDRGREERGGPDVAGQFRQAPPVLDGERVAPGRLEPGLGQYLGIGPSLRRHIRGSGLASRDAAGHG